MSLRIRRGTDAQRLGITFDLGEIVYTTDTQKLYVGDGVTVGAKNILASSAGNGITFNRTTEQFDFDKTHLGLTTADVSESLTHQYFTPLRALTSVGDALTRGNQYNNGITFTVDTVNNAIIASVSSTVLANDLDLSGHNVVGTGNIGVSGSITGTSLSAPYITSSTSTISIGSNSTPRGVVIHSTGSEAALNLFGLANQDLGMGTSASRGTLTSPLALTSGDNAGSIKFRAYTGTTYQVAGGLFLRFDGNGPSPSDPNATALGTIALAAGNGSNVHFATFDHLGVFNAPIIKATSYAAGSLPASPDAGWIVFDSTNGVFKGYNGVTWVTLG